MKKIFSMQAPATLDDVESRARKAHGGFMPGTFHPYPDSTMLRTLEYPKFKKVFCQNVNTVEISMAYMTASFCETEWVLGLNTNTTVIKENGRKDWVGGVDQLQFCKTFQDAVKILRAWDEEQLKDYLTVQDKDTDHLPADMLKAVVKNSFSPLLRGETSYWNVHWSIAARNHGLILEKPSNQYARDFFFDPNGDQFPQLKP